MTEMIWCKREKKLFGAIGKVLVGLLVIAAIVVPIIAVVSLVGAIIGTPILLDSYTSITLNFIMIYFIFGIGIVMCVVEPPTKKNLNYSKVLISSGAILSALLIVGTYVILDNPLLAIAGTVTLGLLFMFMGIHIKCKEDYYIKIKDELGHEPTWNEAQEGVATIKEAIAKAKAAEIPS
jgi:hypothetical protein